MTETQTETEPRHAGRPRYRRIMLRHAGRRAAPAPFPRRAVTIALLVLAVFAMAGALALTTTGG